MVSRTRIILRLSPSNRLDERAALDRDKVHQALIRHGNRHPKIIIAETCRSS